MKFSLPNAIQNATHLTRNRHLTEAKAAFQRFLENVKPAIDNNPADQRQQTAFRPTTGERAMFGYSPVSVNGHPERASAKPKAGRFLPKMFNSQAGSRPYKLYIPSGYHGQPVPLIVMLHGCTQSPDDFAAGTGMNVAAEEHTCLVIYPGQTSAANPQKCWNWFNRADQRRDGGEPSLIAGITREVMRDYAIDPVRVYVAGLSAGGAAAAIVGNAYPELFAAIGVHSGLACGSARDMASAYKAMQRGADGIALPYQKRIVPAIVFHGEQDKTVHPRNGDAVVAQSVKTVPLRTSIELGQVPGGHAYSRTLHSDPKGNTIVEKWVVHGAGHAWSGGSSDGSYTDPRGPNATREMLRFFLAHPLTINAS